jgi:thiol:disulfide interchange protein DsbA
VFKTKLSLIIYTLVIIVISAVITTAYIRYSVLAQPHETDAPQTLTEFNDAQVKNSPIEDENSIVEVFSYGCHYCASNEENVAKLEARMPPGSKFIRVHLDTPQLSGLGSYAPLFVTLSVMGLEGQYRQKAYNAVINDRINLADPSERDKWLQANNIDLDAYRAASKSQAAKDLSAYMQKISSYYKINATPSFIVKKKWVAQQDSDFSTFADNLLSMLKNNKPLEK